MTIKRNNGDNVGVGRKRHLDMRIRLICFAIPAVDFMCVEDNIRDIIYVVFELCDTLFNDAESTAAFEGDYNIELMRMRDEAARTNDKWML